MLPIDEQSSTLIPSWIFEQDYLVFLSFFGWMLVGLLAWTKPLSGHEEQKLPWIWIGFYAFSQAASDFLRTLSFSDSFFRHFNLEVGFEMLGYGLLLESAIRYMPRFRGKSFFPYASIAGLFLGLSIEISDLLYTLVVSFLLSVFAVFMACKSFALAAKDEQRKELYFIAIGLTFVLPTWVLVPDRIAGPGADQFAGLQDFPYFGFYPLFLRILAGWTILAGFWYYRLQPRIEDVAPIIRARLKFWGYRVLPGALCLIVFASYMITSWNGQRARIRLENDYLPRAQTSALAMDLAGIDFLDSSVVEREVNEGSLASQLLALKRVGSDVRSVYLWKGDSKGVEVLAFGDGKFVAPTISESFRNLANSEKFKSSEAFILGPIVSDSASVLIVSAPIVNRGTGEITYWLGIDIAGQAWFRSVSLARLQSIIIAGLVMALLIFFLYYQIDHESEADLVLAKERAEAADRAKSEFLAVISHEIRTPLQSVLGYSDLLRSTPLNEKQFACLDSIQSEGKILLRIVQDILDFSNLRKTSFELQNGPVRLRQLIDETFRTIKPMAEARGLQASLVVSDSVPSLVLADGIRLRQVLLNLFGNSVKYTETGSVKLVADFDVKATKENALPLRFTISDTGVGIKEKDLARLFEPFIQLEHTGRFPREGAGLGLAIVNRIVELMGGVIKVKSVFKKGSEFTVSFGFKLLDPDSVDAAPVRPTAGSIAKEARLGKEYPMRILVVDDNPMVRNLMARYLESLGYEPDTVDGGDAASKQGHEYDLIIMDLRMPDVDGPTASTIIRERTGKADTPWIVAVSASLQEGEVKRARDAGVNDFLGKPFFASSLAEKIRAIPTFESFFVDLSDLPDSKAEESIEKEHTPIFIPPVEKQEMPASVFAGAGSFSTDAVKTAVAEVYTIHDEMLVSRLSEDWDDIREKAHYLSNTAMALGIDQLYLDSKNLQAAAEEKAIDKIDKILPELRLNFEAWERDE